jgi:virulence factor
MTVIKLGMLDFDTSHSVEFTKRLNHKAIGRDQWVEGAKVVVGCPGTSEVSPEVISKYRSEVEQLGVRIVAKAEDMIGQVDGMLIESQGGGVHLERARPFLEAGIPCFIDKPFACDVADARQLVALSKKKDAPIFSASSLRFAPEVVSFLEGGRHGKLIGAVTYGQASLHPKNPGFFHYGIHAVETLYTLMGHGCKRVQCMHEIGADVVSGQWQEGRIASIRGIRAGATGFGFLAFTERGIFPVQISFQFIYRELLKKVVEFFEKKQAPVEAGVMVEIVAFIEAALKSENNHGAGEMLAV